MGSKKIAVIGAGITGPATALTLARAGHDVTVYERRRPDALFSAGILGITPGNWSALVLRGVDVERYRLSSGFLDVNTGLRETSPFVYVTWNGLHRSLTEAAQAAGARFAWETSANPREVPADYVMDAGGIFTAAHWLTSEYSGTVCYRGISRDLAGEDFATFHMADGAGYFTIGDTPEGAAWALFVQRDRPGKLATVDTNEVPAEIAQLPFVFRRAVRHTTRKIVSPLSNWDVPTSAHDPSYRRFALGDATGPVRPVTTSGANLAVMAGMQAGTLVSGTHRQINAMERSLLQRRAFDQVLGAELDGPEIGGAGEDPSYDEHHRMLYLAGEQ